MSRALWLALSSCSVVTAVAAAGGGTCPGGTCRGDRSRGTLDEDSLVQIMRPGAAAPAPAVDPPSCHRKKAKLPEKVLASYIGAKSVETVVRACLAGVNIVIWDFFYISGNDIKGDAFDPAMIREIHDTLESKGIKVLHLASMGGWNAPHEFVNSCGDQKCCGRKYAQSFRRWNEKYMKLVGGTWPGFVGLDADIEGNDDVQSPSNEMQLEELEVVLDMFRDLRHDYIISFAPPQGYFDCAESRFDLDMRHPAEQNPDFHYHGRNTFAPWIAKCPECFDCIYVQFFEGYSHDGFLAYWDGIKENVGKPGFPRRPTFERQVDILRDNIECMASGNWKVKFNGFWGLPDEMVIKVPKEKIVVGLANEWSKKKPWGNGWKFPYFDSKAATEALHKAGGRGFGYYCMSQEDETNSFTRGLAEGMGLAKPQ